MNALNRIIVVLMLLVAIPLCNVLLITPVELARLIQSASNTAIETLSQIRPEIRYGVGILLALVLDALLILWLLFEVRPPRRIVRVPAVSGAIVAVAVDSIRERLKYHLDQLADVIEVHPRVIPHREGLRVELDVLTTPEIEVPSKAQEVLQMARVVVEDKMGLRLYGQPVVRIRHAPYPKGGARPTPPTAHESRG
ncbi:hypothetical protein HRbin22_02314 [Candidatus Thermoflexus japonica]|uniref:Alkaline shock response membrane anchor protein AmaP n=1 Tax=Candidatus Thermoflexus japonica TaxID=2035417 RepID=A0A2H5Y9F4_9CHLR|nr:hypothetical protein HRbin22_02314 [Candidatus Thermoflexus japonica]